MRIRSWWVFTGLALAGVASSPAQADGSWTGPGWYVEATQTGFFDSTLISGPYADEDHCKAALPEDTDDNSYYCEDEETDPTVEKPPRVRA